MTTRPHSTVLFDLDGTLTDPKPGITRSIAHALTRMGHTPPADLDQLAWCIGPPLRHSFRQLLATDERDPVEAAIGFYRERFADVGLFENTPYPGMADLLRQLAERGTTLALATSKPHIYARRIAERYGFLPYLQGIYGPELDGTRDSKHAVVEWALAETGAERATTAMVGDRAPDMAAARDFGLDGIGVTYGYGSMEELRDAGARRWVGSVEELAALLLGG